MENLSPTPPPAEAASVRRNPLIPLDQDQKAALAVFLVEAWKANPQLVLLWTTQSDFAAQVAAYTAKLKARMQAGALRTQQTLSFAEYDQLIQNGLDDVKAYLNEAYGKTAAKSFYAEFGIEKRGSVYDLPRAQPERAAALALLEAALVAHGFDGRKFGTAYWAPIAAGYATLMAKARQDAATVSGLVGEKDELGDEIDEVLSAMISLVEAQYRSEPIRKAKLRELGYQREYN